MPKNQPERIIDSPFVASVRGGGGTSTSQSGSGSVTVHDLDGPFHTGTLSWNKVNKTGSNLTDLVTRAHNDLQSLTTGDPHTQYAYLAGRTGGQTWYGGNASGEGLTLESTSHATKGGIVIGPDATTLVGVGATEIGYKFNVNGALRATGAAVLGSTLAVTGATTLSDALDVAGATTLGSTLDVTGAATLGSTLAVAGATTLANTLDVDGAADFDDTLDVLGNTTLRANLTVDTNVLYVDAATDNVAINHTPDGSTALWVTSKNNDDVTLRLRQKSGQTARIWRVDNAAGQELIVLDSVGNLQSGNPGFVSGLTGWRITPEGNVEFNNGWFRGELHASVFVSDEFHATGGTFFVATAGVLKNDAAIDSATTDTFELEIESSVPGFGSTLTIETASGTFTGSTLQLEAVQNWIDINDPPSGHAQLFQPGDTLRCKSIGFPAGGLSVFDHWWTVNDSESLTDSDGVTFYRYYIQKRSGTDTTLPAGAGVVSYGQEGDGRILLTSDLNTAPYIDVFTVGPNVWTGAAGSVIPHVRLGRLDGVGVDGVSGIEQYGLIAGTDLSDNNAPRIVASNLQLALYRVNLEANDGTATTVSLTSDGDFRLGADVTNDATTGLQFSRATGNVLIGSESSGHYVKWDQAAGQITIGGNAVLPAPDWNDIDKPGRFAYDTDPIGQPSGLYLTGTRMGYWDSAASTFISHIDSLGNANFGLYGAGGQGMLWNQSAATLSIRGAIQVTGGNAETTKRRVVAVQGTWTKGAGTLSWSGASVTLADGTQISISDGSTSIPATRILLIDTAGSSPQVLSVQPTTYVPGSASLVVIGKATPDTAGGNVALELYGGETSIGPGWIQTGAITANKISVSSLEAINVNTGKLNLSGQLVFGAQNTSVITTGSHASPNTFANANMYLGWDEDIESRGIGGAGGNAINTYKMRFGGSQTSLVYNGNSLALVTSGASGVRPLRIRSALSSAYPAIILETTADSTNTTTAKIWRNSTKGIGIEGDLTSVGGLNNMSGWGQISCSTLNAASQVNAPSISASSALSTPSLTISNAGNITGLAPAWNGGGFVIGTNFTATGTDDQGNPRYLRYCKMGELVILAGYVRRTASFNTLIAELPAAIKPITKTEGAAFASGNVCVVSVNPDGNLYLVGASSGAIDIMFTIPYTLT